MVGRALEPESLIELRATSRPLGAAGTGDRHGWQGSTWRGAEDEDSPPEETGIDQACL